MRASTKHVGLVLVLLVGCGGSDGSIEPATTKTVKTPPAVATAVLLPEAPSPGQDGGIVHAGPIDASTDADQDASAVEPLDAGTDAEVEPDAGNDSAVDAGTEDAGADAGAGVELDAGQDSSVEVVDAGVADAGVDVDAEPPPPPPVCSEGASRCHDYQLQYCINNAWVWRSGFQDCCHDPRFTVSGTEVTDATTGRVWYRYGGQGTGGPICPAVIAGGRLPTTAELVAIIIGPPVNNVSVCSPAVDQVAFSGVYPGDTATSDGCVDLIRAMSKTSCTESTPGFLCVKD